MKYTQEELVEKIRVQKKVQAPENSKEINCRDKRYYADNKILRTIIKENINEITFTDRSYVYHISTLINSFYSTRMGADRIYAISMKIANNGAFIKQILSKEKCLCDTELNSIHEKFCEKLRLRTTERSENDRSFCSYSFFTKFLAIHSRYTSKDNISSFPIYDGQVKTVIESYKLNTISDLKNFIDLFGRNNKGLDNLFNDLKKTINEKTPQKRTIYLRNYVIFYKLMNVLSIATELDLTTLDQFFWKLGGKIQEERGKEDK